MARRVSAYEVLNKKSPAIVYIQNAVESNTTPNTTDITLKRFTDAFGSVSDFDSALAKVKGHGYGFYNNSIFSIQETINRMKSFKGTNCTDSAQVFYRIALGLGYDVQFIHVKCKSGTGHVRLRLKHSKNTGGKWIYRDPASVLKGNSITSNWCMNGTVLAYDPRWIFEDLYW